NRLHSQAQHSQRCQWENPAEETGGLERGKKTDIRTIQKRARKCARHHSSTFRVKFREGSLPLVRNQDEIPGPSEKPFGRQWYRDRYTLSQTYQFTRTIKSEVRI